MNTVVISPYTVRNWSVQYLEMWRKDVSCWSAVWFENVCFIAANSVMVMAYTVRQRSVQYTET